MRVSPDLFRSTHLPSLDGLRFVAVLLVMLCHGGLDVPSADGVTFFFVLSGFLFAWLLGKEWRSTGTISLRAFYFRRTMRIVPAFYVCLLVTVATKWALRLPLDFGHALSALCYVSNYYNALYDHPATGFSSFWSLAVEEQFYLVWPICYLVLARRGENCLIWFLVGTIATVCVWRTILFAGFGVGDAYFYNAFDARADSLAIGCLLGLLVSRPGFARYVEWSGCTGFAPFVTLLLLHLAGLGDSAFQNTLGFTLQSALMAMLLLQMIVLGSHPLWSWLNHPAIRYLGTLSYSMYLYHHWGLAAGLKLRFLPLECQVFAGVVCTAFLAAISYYAIERPALALRKRWEGFIIRPGTPAATVTAVEPPGQPSNRLDPRPAVC